MKSQNSYTPQLLLEVRHMFSAVLLYNKTKRKYAFIYESEYRHCAYGFCSVVFFSDRRFNYAR